jgi:hypothetical protein
MTNEREENSNILLLVGLLGVALALFWSERKALIVSPICRNWGLPARNALG